MAVFATCSQRQLIGKEDKCNNRTIIISAVVKDEHCHFGLSLIPYTGSEMILKKINIYINIGKTEITKHELKKNKKPFFVNFFPC